MKMMQNYYMSSQQIEKIMSSLLDLQLIADDTDQVIYQCFVQISKIINVRRCYLFLFCNFQTKFELTHEWCETDGFARKGKLTGLDINRIAWLIVG